MVRTVAFQDTNTSRMTSLFWMRGRSDTYFKNLRQQMLAIVYVCPVTGVWVLWLVERCKCTRGQFLLRQCIRDVF